MEDYLDGALIGRQVDLCNPLPILLLVYDDFLIAADKRLNLSMYAGQIILDTRGFYVTPHRFKLKLIGATIVLGALWPLFGLAFVVLMIRKVRELRWQQPGARRRCSCGRNTWDGWVRVFMILMLYLAGCAHWACFLPKLHDYAVVSKGDVFAGELSFAEICEPSMLMFLLVSSWTLEIALLRLEQSAAAQLSNELKEYDDWIKDASSNTTGGIDDLKRTFDLLGSIFFRWHDDKRLSIEKSSGRDLYLRLFEYFGREGATFGREGSAGSGHNLPHHQRQPIEGQTNASPAGGRNNSGVSLPNSAFQGDTPINDYINPFQQGSTWGSNASALSLHRLQVEIHGERLSSQVRVTLQRRYHCFKLFGWVLVAAFQASIPMLTRLAQHQPALVSGNAGTRDQLLFLLFIPVNYVAMMNFFAYWDDGLRRLNRLTELLVLILYLFGTKSSRTAIGGQFSRYINKIVVTSGAYIDTPLSDIDSYDKFFEDVSFKAWTGNDKVNHQTIQAFLCIRKYMNIVVATERVRVQQVFYASVYMSLACIAGTITELWFNRGKAIPVTAVVCIVDLVLLSVVLTSVFSAAVNLNEVLADATTFLLESWRENIHMQRLSLSVLQQQPQPTLDTRGMSGSASNNTLSSSFFNAPSRNAVSAETADRALEFLVRFVEKRQVSIGFFSIPITRTFRNSVGWGILTLLFSITGSLVIKYVDDPFKHWTR